MKLDSLNTETLKEIIKVAKDEGVLELNLEGKDFKVSVSFASSQTVQLHEARPIIHSTPTSVPVAHNGAHQDIGVHIIKSPFVGTFYAAPSPGKPNYVNVGDKVKIGQALCVLEAMKIMNEIDSDIHGEILEICVENESLVEYGQPLFKIKI
jgi:acetyl-CoA carboxylase biotin carboxyl carrier protein